MIRHPSPAGHRPSTNSLRSTNGRRTSTAATDHRPVRWPGEAEFGAIERHIRSDNIRAGQTLVGYQDDLHDLFFILTGKLKVTIFSEAGREVAFRELMPGRVSASCRRSMASHVRPMSSHSRTPRSGR